MSFNTVIQTKDFIWYNSEIRIDNKPFLWKTPYNRGLKYIYQLYKNQRLKSIKAVNEEFGLTLMQFNSLISTIPQHLKTENTYHAENQIQASTAKEVYTFLVREEKILHTKLQTWENDLKCDILYQNFAKSFQHIVRISNIPKYRSFQYRLLHRAIVNNIHLKHWKIIEDDNCTLCGQHRETYLHLFIYCKKVEPIWLKLKSYMKRYGLKNIDFNERNVIFNCLIPDQPSHIKNFLCLVTKQYIYRQWCLRKDLSFNELIALIYSLENNEKYIASKSNKLLKHHRKWYPDTEQAAKTNRTNIDEYITSYIEMMNY